MQFIQPDTLIPDFYNPQFLNRYSYALNNPLRYNDPSGHCPVCIAVAVVALKVIDYGWTGYDIFQAGKVYFDESSTEQAKKDATRTIGMAVAFELLEPDDLTPGLPIDDAIRHGDDIVQGANNVASQVHHFATNKNKRYTSLFEDITEKFDLGLDEAWNKAPVPAHRGRHPNAYHDWVLNQMNDIADSLSSCKNGCADKFVESFREKVIQPVIKNPDMLRKKFWEMLE